MDERQFPTLRQQIDAGQIVVAPGAYDPLSARLVQDTGFGSLYLGGYTTGAHLCTSEPLLTMTEQVAVAERIARNVDIPVIVDGGAGWGEPVHMARTVREFELAGVSAIHIEDQVYPKRAHFHKGLSHVIPMNEAVDKLKAALAARSSRDFLIIGRTDAYEAVGGGFDEALRRLDAYATLGVDGLMLGGTPNPEVVARLHDALPELPMVWMGANGSLGLRELTIAEAVQIGCRIIVYPIAPIVVAVGAVMEYLHHIQRDEIFYPGDFDTNRILLEKVLGMEKHYAIEAATTERE